MSSQRKKQRKPNAQTQKLRIIGGKWRGRLLDFPDVDGLRPSGSRIRETLFNWLAPHLPGSRCLDLYAGSGALAFEALSRGASFCQILELNHEAANQLKINAQKLASTTAEILRTDTLVFLANEAPKPFDIVFVDPPFAKDLWQPTISQLENNRWLQNGSLVYLEAPKDFTLPVPHTWKLLKQKSAGQVQYALFQYTPLDGTHHHES